MRTPIVATIFLITLQFVAPVADGQTISIPAKIPKLLTVYETSVSFGFHHTMQQGTTTDQFRTLIGPSIILSQFPEELDQQRSLFHLYGIQPFTYSALTSFRFADHKRESYRSAPSLRIGINYRSGNLLTGFSNKETVQQIDSFLNPVTMEMNYIDSLHMTYMSLELASEQLFLDASMVFSTKAERIFSVYAGAGLSAGIPVMSNANIGLIESHQRVTRTASGKQTFHSGATIAELDESVSGSPYLVLIPYIPLGFNARLSKKNPFLNQISLFYEGRVGLHMGMLHGTNNLHHLTRHHSLGIKVRW